MEYFTRKMLLFDIIKCLVFFTACTFSYFVPAHADAEPQATPSATTEKDKAGPITLVKVDTSYQYRYEGRPDPFLPFISDKAESTHNPEEIVENEEQLSGMQLFEPGQLTLVGLVNTPDQKFAMVEDVSGKGYIIKEGTKIGRKGVVRSIIPNKVLIEETAMTRAGKKITSDIVMVLRKEEKIK